MTDLGSRGGPLDGLLTVMWHYVRSDHEGPRVGAGWVEPSEFDRQLDRIASSRTVVAWPDVVATLDGGPPLSPDAALLTFDDGLVDHARTVGPRLAARGWSGIFFTLARRPGDRLSIGHRLHILLADLSPEELRGAVVDRLGSADRAVLLAAEARALDSAADRIDVLKRPLQRDLAATVDPILSALVEARHGPEADVADALHLSPVQIAELRRDGHVIGGHGRHHSWFDHEPAAAVGREIDESAAFLVDERQPWAFAYPYGASSREAPTVLAARGFAAAFHASPRNGADRYALGRFDAETDELDRALEVTTG
jgi:peptidoglycan/xylan/chitin deacetylase (PgdA/CDA1 family)